ncbi:rho GTPase-activating protein gacJJ-like isoform X1 [Acropora muricata]|uniref:rho GTPase-activating protein gacJJ-like isoform X1 n=1 Tax=Acropora muricata TaxID=159855 RepID=UPI0034E427B2
MKDLSAIDFKDNVRYVVRRYLKTLGIKVPKQKSSKPQPTVDNNKSGVFGVCLDKVESVNVGEDFYCSVPKFLVDSATFLQQHISTEGLFRKSGSVQRQKVLKQKADLGEELQNVQPHDVASLVKQFFRQLPEPLLTNHLYDCFVKTQRLDEEGDQVEAVLLLCLLLPIAHLTTLQFIMRFLAKVASCSQQSKMGTNNLAIVLTPNLIHSAKKEGNCPASEKQLKEQTAVIDLLLQHADKIGLVSEDIYERAKLIDDDLVDSLTQSSGDELDDNMRRGSKRQSRPRTRTGSLSGFVTGLGQRFKTSSSKVPSNIVSNPAHRRSKSVKAELMRKDKYSLDDAVLDKKNVCELENLVVRNNQRMSVRLHNKRRPYDTNVITLSPATKSRRALLTDMTNDQGISHPRLVSASTQMFTTPIKPLMPSRPVHQMVKPGHSRILLSNETEHVKVVDTMSYIPSPNGKCASPTMSAASNELLVQSPNNGRNGTTRRRIKRRHSSGATSCFSNSPRNKHQDSSKNTAASKESHKSNDRPHSPSIAVSNDALEMSHISVAATLESVDTPTQSRVRYAGASLPCKYHKATPPMPSTEPEFRKVLSQEI